MTHRPHRRRALAALGARATYGVGDLGFLVCWQGAGLFLLFFYTEIAGLPALVAGAIILVGMVWDALTDPIFAAYAERRAARGRPYAGVITASAPVLGLTYAALFFTPGGPLWLVAFWALVSHLAFRSAYGLASMPYNALVVRLSMDGRERSILSAWRVAAAALGGLLVAVLTPVIAGALGGQASGYLLAAGILGGLATASLLITGLGVREAPDAPPVAAQGEPSYRRALVELAQFAARTGPLARLLAIMLTATVGFAIFTGALIFHLQARPELAAQLPVLLATPTLASLVAVFFWPLAASIWSKRTAMVAGSLIAAAGFIGVGAAPDVITTLAALAVAGAGLAAIPVMLWSMVADAVDYGHLETGERVEARVFGLFTFVQKTASGIAALALAAGLAAGEAATGVGGAASPDGLIIVLVSLAPVGFMVLTALIAVGYSIDRATHDAVVAALDRKVRGAAS